MFATEGAVPDSTTIWSAVSEERLRSATKTNSEISAQVFGSSVTHLTNSMK
jgi:hypothetical protein